MNILWRVIEAVLSVFAVVFLLVVSVVSWLSERRKSYVIRKHFAGDEAAYYREQWKRS